MSGERQRISSLRDLPRDIAPPRDLWQGIEARIAAEPRGVAAKGGAEWARRAQGNRWRILAAAAVVAALAFGIWIGRTVLPVPGKPVTTATGLSASNAGAGAPEALHAALVMDPKYAQERAALLRSLEAKIAALPPDSRAKVMASLQTIQDSIHDLEAALGRDPSNALLQELLVNTYQDEMRVLTAVHEAGNAEGI